MSLTCPTVSISQHWDFTLRPTCPVLFFLNLHCGYCRSNTGPCARMASTLPHSLSPGGVTSSKPGSSGAAGSWCQDRSPLSLFFCLVLHLQRACGEIAWFACSHLDSEDCFRINVAGGKSLSHTFDLKESRTQESRALWTSQCEYRSAGDLTDPQLGDLIWWPSPDPIQIQLCVWKAVFLMSSLGPAGAAALPLMALRRKLLEMLKKGGFQNITVSLLSNFAIWETLNVSPCQSNPCTPKSSQTTTKNRAVKIRIESSNYKIIFSGAFLQMCDQWSCWMVRSEAGINKSKMQLKFDGQD